ESTAEGQARGAAAAFRRRRAPTPRRAGAPSRSLAVPAVRNLGDAGPYSALAPRVGGAQVDVPRLPVDARPPHAVGCSVPRRPRGRFRPASRKQYAPEHAGPDDGADRFADLPAGSD